MEGRQEVERTGMKCETTSDPDEFWEKAHAWLEADAVLNSVILSNVLRLREGGFTPKATPTFAIVREAGAVSEPNVDGRSATGGAPSPDIVGVAMRTPPFHVYVSAMPPEAIETLVDALLDVCPDNDGVTGTVAEAEAFALAWARRTGLGARRGMRQRLHALDTVVPARPVPGEIRIARREDRDLLIAWWEAFEKEANAGRGGAHLDPAQAVDSALAEDRAFVWDDGGPVSYVGITPTIAGVVRIGPVYTPPERRGRGYASAAVAAVSQGALDAGARRCCLYTDLDNPTPNKIYAAVGYRPVADIAMYKMRAAE